MILAEHLNEVVVLRVPRLQHVSDKLYSIGIVLLLFNQVQHLLHVIITRLYSAGRRISFALWFRNQQNNVSWDTVVLSRFRSFHVSIVRLLFALAQGQSLLHDFRVVVGFDLPWQKTFITAMANAGF